MGKVKTTLALFRACMNTPIGQLHVITDEQGVLRALDWVDYEDRLQRLLQRHYSTAYADFEIHDKAIPSDLHARLEAYFAGELEAVNDIAVATNGTPFQRQVWQALRDIPVGTTQSYGELSKTIDRPKAVRAVGMANGANPIGIVVPCHRVIGANKTLTGYAGGIQRKQWLLTHEGCNFAV